MCDSAATSVPTWLLCRAVFRPSCAQASDRTRDDFQARHTIEVEKLVELVRVLGGDLNVEPGECALQGGARRAADSQGVVVDSLKEFLYRVQAACIYCCYGDKKEETNLCFGALWRRRSRCL